MEESYVNRGEVHCTPFAYRANAARTGVDPRHSPEVPPGVTIAPITSTIRSIPTEVVLTPDEDGVVTVSAVNLDNLHTIPKSNLGGLIAILSPDKTEAVKPAICFALGMDHLL